MNQNLENCFLIEMINRLLHGFVAADGGSRRSSNCLCCHCILLTTDTNNCSRLYNTIEQNKLKYSNGICPLRPNQFVIRS